MFVVRGCKAVSWGLRNNRHVLCIPLDVVGSQGEAGDSRTGGAFLRPHQPPDPSYWVLSHQTFSRFRRAHPRFCGRVVKQLEAAPDRATHCSRLLIQGWKPTCHCFDDSICCALLHYSPHTPCIVRGCTRYRNRLKGAPQRPLIQSDPRNVSSNLRHDAFL